MRFTVLASLFALFMALFTGAAAASQTPVPAQHTPQQPIGRFTSYFSEPAGRLSLEQAIAAHQRGAFTAAHSASLTFGIGPKPVWIHFQVSNPTGQPITRRLSIETPWLDQVDVYFRRAAATTAEYHVGDRKPFALRPVDSRYFVFDHGFQPGLEDVYIRVETADPMAVPIYLTSLDEAEARQTAQDYSYGFLYGFLFALLIYNVMLYAGLRHSRYILYSAYLAMFLLMNISYTGHGFRWLWPQHTTWAQWSNPVLMVLYGISGIVFALRFLEMRTHFPRIRKAVLALLGLVGALLLAAIALDHQRWALLVAFNFVFLFTAIMLGMGIISVGSGKKPAQYFLLAAIAAMIGAACTALAVWGFIPFNTWTFRAVDIGVLLDATLLALALTYQFRVGQAQRLRAEQLATLDPLTGISNRRAFYDKTLHLWNMARRHDHPLSVILLDIDRFKRVNDTFGHAFGDEVLTATAKVLSQCIRDQDVMARWGGEEFILLLPETGVREAVALAERLRRAVAGIPTGRRAVDIKVTASFGVAQRQPHHHSLDALISTADRYLYQSKSSGRNQVSYALDPDQQPEDDNADVARVP